MNWIGNTVVSKPRLIIATALSVTVLMAAAIVIRGIKFNGSLETLIQKGGDQEFYNKVRSTFGDDHVIIVGLTTGDVFTSDFIKRLDRLTSDLDAVKGVTETQSLANIKAVRRADGGLVLERLIPRDADDAVLSRLRAEVTHDPLYAKNIISEDGRTAAINVFLAPLDEVQTRRVAEDVERIARSESAGDELLLAGVPIMDARGIHSMVRDMLVCSPVAALMCLVVFFLAFRSFWGAVLPVSALLMGLVWVLGVMSLLGTPITIATLSLPTTLMAVGGSYMFHVLNQYRISTAELTQRRQAGGRQAPSRRTAKRQPGDGPAQVGADARPAQRAAWHCGLGFIGPAVLVSGLATMAGFGALASSSIPTVRDMGLFETGGVLAMLMLTLTFIPAVLMILPCGSLGGVGSASRGRSRAFSRMLQNVTALILHRRPAIWAGTIILTVLIGAGLLRLVVNTDYLKIFPRSSETVQSAQKLHERLAGAAPVELVVSGRPGSIYDPSFLNGVESLEQFVRSRPDVDSAISVVDIVMRMNALLDSKAGAADSIPSDRGRVESIFRDYLSQEKSVSRLVDLGGSGSDAVVVLRTNVFSSRDLKRLVTELDKWSRENLPAGMTVRATGSAILLNAASDAVGASQVSSLAIALTSIYLMMVVLFGSLVVGAIALIPNLLPILGFFGFLGWTGTPLDMTTSLVATAALGLAVDNAVHVIRRYRQCSGECRDEGSAMWQTMLRTGKPMILANVMLIAAFLIFVVSSFVPVRLAGVLWAVTITGCLAANLFFLPVLMKCKPFAKAALGRSRTPAGSASEVDVVYSGRT
jgi:predicted RND superfamily exporter protein